MVFVLPLLLDTHDEFTPDLYCRDLRPSTGLY